MPRRWTDTSPPILRVHTLARDVRVRLRLARRGDVPRVRALLSLQGMSAGDTTTHGMVRFDPRGREVIVATVLRDGSEMVIGFGASDLGDGASPDTIVCDELMAPGLGALLQTALVERVQARAPR